MIGLNLCPFAKRVFQGELIRYAVSEATDAEVLRTDLGNELAFLAAEPITVVETTLLIHPQALERFADYCDFLAEAERLLKSRGFVGVIQIASFHPQYQFEGSEPDAVENFTNRSPYPMLHLLRELSVSNVAEEAGDLSEIPRRNAALLRRLGRDKLLQLLKSENANAL